MSSTTTTHEANETDDRYITFLLEKELYGVPLLSVREVVEWQNVKPIPNTAPYFLGVINIRGEIVGVVDLRIKLGHKVTQAKSSVLIVFDTPEGPVAIVVDSLDAVVTLTTADIERNPNIQSKLPIEYLLGVGKNKEKLITLLDLQKTLSDQKFIQMRGKLTA